MIKIQQFPPKTRHLLPYFNASLGQVRARDSAGEAHSPPLQSPMQLSAMGLFLRTNFIKNSFF